MTQGREMGQDYHLPEVNNIGIYGYCCSKVVRTSWPTMERVEIQLFPLLERLPPLDTCVHSVSNSWPITLIYQGHHKLTFMCVSVCACSRKSSLIKQKGSRDLILVLLLLHTTPIWEWREIVTYMVGYKQKDNDTIEEDTMGCPKDQTRFRDKCYKALTNTLTFEEAVTSCKVRRSERANETEINYSLEVPRECFLRLKMMISISSSLVRYLQWIIFKWWMTFRLRRWEIQER